MVPMAEEVLVWEAVQSPSFDTVAFVASLQVKPLERDAIAAFEQRSGDWKRARFGRMTASNFGAAAGHHLPGASKRVLTAMLWPEDYKLTGKAASFAEWGTTMENVAKGIYTAHRKKAPAPALAPLLTVTQT